MTAATFTEAGEAALPPRPPSRSSFYLAMRILPHGRREAMYAVYAFCRAVDDVADGGGPRDERLAGLERWRADIDNLYRDGVAPPRLAALHEAIRQFGLRRDDFHAVIDGMAMDVTADIRAPQWDTLDLYCDRVASAVGRLSVRIFGLEEEAGIALAHHLGRALQLTNILRDLDEDAALGRLYVPREALASAGIDDVLPQAVLDHPQVGAACAQVADRAEQHFAAADRIMASCPRATVHAPRLMRAAYGSILERLRRRGWNPPRERVSSDKLRLAAALMRYGLF